MATNGILKFQGTNKATFVGATSNVVIDTVKSSLGIGVDVDGPTSNLHVVGNAYVSTELTVGGTVTAAGFAGPLTGAVTGDGSGLTALPAAEITGTLPNDLVTLGTHTTGNYVTSLIGGDGVTAGAAAEGGTPTIAVDLKANGGLVIESSTIAVDLSASSITGTLAVANGGTGVTGSTGTGSVVLSIAPAFSGDVAFNTDTLVVDATNDRVGIGTTSPQYRLDVGHGGGATAATDVMLRVMSSSSTSGKLIFGRSGTTDIRSHAIETYNSSGADNNYMKFLVHDGTGTAPYETRTEVMTLRGDGNVGIGTTAPMNTGLHIANSYFASGGNTDHFNPQLFITGDSGTSGNQVSAIGFSGNSSADTHQRMVGGAMYYKGGGGNYGLQGYLGIAVPDISSSGSDPYGLTEGELDSQTRIAINNDGNVGIGTTSPDSGFKLHVDGIIKAQAVNCSGSGPVITCTASNPGDMISKRYASADRYGMGQYAGGITRLFTSTAYSSGRICFSGATDDVTGSAAAFTDYVTIENDGNVGIGTTSPGRPLDVQFTGDHGIRSKNTGTTSSDHASVYIDSGSGYSYLRFESGGAAKFWLQSTPTGDLAFRPSGGGHVMDIKNNGNVGIGTSDPDSKLQIKPNHTSYSNPAATSGLVIYNETNSDPSITHAILNLRTGGSSGGDPFISYDVAAEHGWSIGIDNSAGRQLRFGQSWANFDSTKAYISQNSTAAEIDFTGQHRSFIDTIAHTDYLKYEGLIVSANKNQYFDIQEEIVTGVQAIKINESLPLVSISNVAYDKCCFGVISGSEDTNDREYSQGSFVSVLKKQDGDIRAHVNSVGEGAIWVVNTNGILESGDYITTSNVAGYGQKQDSEFLANYTVAKITMDCDFNPSTQPTRIIKRELRDVNYWVKYTYDDISEEEYTRVKNLGRRVRIIDGGTEISHEEYENHLKKEGYTITESNTYIRNETTHQRVFSDKKMEPTDGFNLEVRNEPVNVLDEHGQIQWEDHPTETEKAYKIRYLDANGVITDEANAVHTAAFVGCTYHCG